MSREVPVVDGGIGDCVDLDNHPPHDWVYDQLDYGPRRKFRYHCRGVKSVVIERYEE